MSLNIKTATGLLEIGGNVTKEKVISALGYEPANKEVESTVDTHTKDTDIHITTDERTLWIKNVESLDAHTTDTTVHVTSAERTTWNNKSDFSGAYADLIDAPNITETETGNMVIADESGNIIMQVDENGLATTNVGAKTIKLNGEDLGTRLDELESISLPNILDNESGDLTISDESGNVIMKVDASGLETTTVTAKSAIINGVDITTYVDTQVANLVNSAPEALNTLDELAAALGNDANFATTVTNQIASKVDQTEFDKHTHTKADIGLGNVDNTADINKPVSTAQQTALDNLKSELSESIVSESTEWTVVDDNGNVALKVDSNGLETAVVTAKSVVVNGTDIETEFSELNTLIGTKSVQTQISEAITAQNLSQYATDTDLSTHTSDTVIHITSAERTAWNNKADLTYVNTELDKKSDSGHTHTITASASDDDVVVLTGTNGDNKVTYTASHSTSGVTAGTYKNVTVNEYGHVTGGTNPTTLSGYGITDATSKFDFEGHIDNKGNPHGVTKAQVGLGNVDNTADINKPVSTAQQEALNNLKTELSEEIVSESREWTIVDELGNIIAKVNSDGLITTTIVAQTMIIGDVDVSERIDEHSEILNNYILNINYSELEFDTNEII